MNSEEVPLGLRDYYGCCPRWAWRERTGHEREQHRHAHPLSPRGRIGWTGSAVLLYALVAIEWVEEIYSAMNGYRRQSCRACTIKVRARERGMSHRTQKIGDEHTTLIYSGRDYKILST